MRKTAWFLVAVLLTALAYLAYWYWLEEWHGVDKIKS